MLFVVAFWVQLGAPVVGAIVSGMVGLTVQYLPVHLAIASTCVFAVAMAYIGIHLGNVVVYDTAEVAAARQQPVVSFLVDLSYKRRVFEVLLDAALVVFAWYLAGVFVYGVIGFAGHLESFTLIAATLVLVKPRRLKYQPKPVVLAQMQRSSRAKDWPIRPMGKGNYSSHRCKWHL